MLLHDKPSLAPGLSGNRLPPGSGVSVKSRFFRYELSDIPDDDPELSPLKVSKGPFRAALR